jgi:hypothetical protein
MSLYYNGQQIRRPYHNGVKVNAYYNGVKIWNDTMDLLWVPTNIPNLSTSSAGMSVSNNKFYVSGSGAFYALNDDVNWVLANSNAISPGNLNLATPTRTSSMCVGSDNILYVSGTNINYIDTTTGRPVSIRSSGNSETFCLGPNNILYLSGQNNGIRKISNLVVSNTNITTDWPYCFGVLGNNMYCSFSIQGGTTSLGIHKLNTSNGNWSQISGTTNFLAAATMPGYDSTNNMYMGGSNQEI